MAVLCLLYRHHQACQLLHRRRKKLHELDVARVDGERRRRSKYKNRLVRVKQKRRASRVIQVYQGRRVRRRVRDHEESAGRRRVHRKGLRIRRLKANTAWADHSLKVTTHSRHLNLMDHRTMICKWKMT